jgi:hypothetical protein
MLLDALKLKRSSADAHRFKRVAAAQELRTEDFLSFFRAEDIPRAS